MTFIRDPHNKWHVQCYGESTACGMYGFNRAFLRPETRFDPPHESLICRGCLKAAMHIATVGLPDSGIPVSSPAIGSGRRRY